jgi:DNA polymerase-3 subunit beta
MKFICDGQELASASSVVSKVLAVKSNIPVLDGIKIKAASDTLTLSVYNQEIFIEKKIKAEIFIEGEIIVEGRLFNDYISKIHSKERVEIEKIDEENISIRFNFSEIQMQFYEKENFPQFGEYEGNQFFEIKEKELKELIDRALFCVSMNNNRVMLKSCSFSVKGDEAEAVCLDGFRIAISKKKIEKQNGDINFIIFGKIVSDIIKTLDDSDEIIKVSKEGNMVLFDKGHTKIKVNTIDGEFYNYKLNLPAEERNEIIVNKDDLDECLQRASVICRDAAYNKIVLSIEEGTINIKTESEKGRINENINCKNSGDPIKIGLNCRYIQEAISKIKEDFVKIIIERPSKPILIKQIEEDEYKCIVLPLRLIG